MNSKTTRRNFLKSTSLISTSLIVGFKFNSPNLIIAKETSELDPNLYVIISPNNTITFKLPNIELGQGTHTGQAIIIAEELEVNLDKVNVINAPPDPRYGRLNTGGSASIRNNFKKLLKIGAATKEILLKAASSKWNVPVDECFASNGTVIHSKSNRSFTFGELANKATKLEVPSNPKLKNNKEYRLIGKSINRIDISEKVNGTSIYGMDVRIPGMLQAVVKQSLVRGGSLFKYNEKEALSVRGVKAVVPIPSQQVTLKNYPESIAVVAESNWQAVKGMEILNPVFKGGDTLNLSSNIIEGKFQEEINKISYPEKVDSNLTFEVEYDTPLYAHATIEPLNFTVNYTEKFCEVWGPTQSQTSLEFYIKELTGLTSDKIKINITSIGGSFGIKQTFDALVQALTISKLLMKPIQVMWTREQEIQNSYPMQMNKNKIRISLNDQGFPLQWDHKIVNSHSFAHRSQKFKKWIDKWNWEPNTSEGFPPIYDIKNFSLGNKSVDFGLASYNFRTTGCNQNCFVIESIIDESAHKANINPLDYRLTLLRNDERHYKLLKNIAKNSYWDVDVKKGQGKGIAINEFMIKKTKEGRNSFGDPTSIVAIISEIEISNKGKLKINKVHCKIDCGICVNPDQVIAQAEGGIMMGISMLLNEEITFENGMVVQSNYDDYKIAKMKHTPEIKVSIVESSLPPAGIAEAVVAPVIPSITNAIFAATGKRIRKLPIGKQKLV